MIIYWYFLCRAMFAPPLDSERIPQNILFVEDLTDRSAHNPFAYFLYDGPKGTGPHKVV